MVSLRFAVVASLLILALPGSAHAAGQKVIVVGPPDARITAAFSAPIGDEGPGLLTVFVSPRPNFRAIERNRALFQRWSGFRKQYSGPKYPF